MPERVLIIDDDPAIVDPMSIRLSDAGYEVFSAPDGTSAIEAAVQSTESGGSAESSPGGGKNGNSNA